MKRDEFEKSIHQLMNLLKKILKNHPAGPSVSQLFESKNLENIVLNLCFFNFIPVSPDELDEFEEIFQEMQEQEIDAHGDGLSDTANLFGWNESDVEFLKRNGMKF